MPRLPHIAAVLAVVALSSSSIVKPPSNDKTFELLILHNNDMHARFEQTSQLSGACTTADREAGKCYGGFPRVAYVVKEARKAAASGEGPPVLYLNAGDTYTGTAWFTIYKWKVAAEFLNALQPDAVSLGNNDFEDGSLMENLQAPVLASNIIIHLEEAQKKIEKFLIKEIQGVKVGIVGYLTPASNILSNYDNVEYIDEVIALNEEVANLKAQGVKIIIALGHSQSGKDVEVATEVEGVDLVITGHQNVFFSNGTNAESNFETAIGPVTVTQKSGKQVPIIQSYAYNKYLGAIAVIFNAKGEIIKYDANPILLDSSIPQDVDVTEIMRKVKDDSVLSYTNAQIGSTVVTLDGTSCRIEECNLGNLVLDSVVFYYARRFQGERWTDAPIAIMNGAALAGNISPQTRPFPISRNDLQTVLPEQNNLVVVTVNGIVLKQILEHAVADFSMSNPSGRLLQFSGIRVEYDLEKASGSRIVNAVARCWDCTIPDFFEIEDQREYKILMPSSLASGNHGYSMLVGRPSVSLEYDALACAAEYIQLRSPVYPEIADRIILRNREVAPAPAPASATALSSTIIVFFLGLLTFCIA